MRTTRVGVFRCCAGDKDKLFIKIYNPCPYPRFSPGYNASLDILIDRDHRTGWCFTETTYGKKLFLYDRRPDHIARSGNVQRAFQLVTVFPGRIESRMLKRVMVEGRIEKIRLVQPAIYSYQVPAQIKKIQPSPEPQQSEVPPSSDQPMETFVEPPMDQNAANKVVEVSSEFSMNFEITVRQSVTSSVQQTPASVQPASQPMAPYTPPFPGSTVFQLRFNSENKSLPIFRYL
ncbi:hypothetical protein P9112_001533 [Eukaryota sp. TZLM1-RC]